MLWWTIRQLKTGTANTKMSASVKLGKSRNRKAIEPLLSALMDRDPQVQEAALKALDNTTLDWRRSDEVSVFLPSIVATLKRVDEDTSTAHPARRAKQAAVRALSKIGDHRAIELLATALKDKDEYVQEESAKALGTIGGELVVEPLFAALKSPFDYVNEPAAISLGKIGDRRAIAPLVTALTGVYLRDGIQNKVKEALENIEPNWKESQEARVAVPSLVNALKTSWGPSIEAAVQTLTEIGDKQAIPLLVTLVDYREHVLNAAIDALEGINPNWRQLQEARKSVPALLTALKENDSSVRRAAAKMLGEIGDERAVEPLLIALEDKSDTVREAATEALKKTRSSESATQTREPEPGKAVFVEEQRQESETVLKEEDEDTDVQTVEHLIEELMNGDEKSRQKAAMELGNLGSVRAIDPLFTALGDGNNEVWRAAIGALRKLGCDVPKPRNTMRVENTPRGHSLKLFFEYIKTHKDKTTYEHCADFPGLNSYYMDRIYEIRLKARLSGTLGLGSEEQIAFKDLIEELEKEGLVIHMAFFGQSAYIITPKGRDTEIVIEGLS